MCNRYGNRGYGMRHEHEGKQFGGRGLFRVPVNITKNETSYELLVFAPDRAKEDFKINIKGNESVKFSFVTPKKISIPSDSSNDSKGLILNSGEQLRL